MSKTYIIEIHPAAAKTVSAGIVVQERSGFRFFAADTAFASLDGCLFRSPSEAEKVATRISGAGTGTAQPRPSHRPVAPAAAHPQYPHAPHFAGDEHVEH
jgi:hypothetical protein